MLLLMDGMESTLLILQDFNSRGTFRIGGVPDTSSEAELAEALRTLERLWFVTAAVEHYTQGGAHGTIPPAPPPGRGPRGRPRNTMSPNGPAIFNERVARHYETEDVLQTLLAEHPEALRSAKAALGRPAWR